MLGDAGEVFTEVRQFMMDDGVSEPLERVDRLEIVAAQHDGADLDGFHVRTADGVITGIGVRTRALEVYNGDITGRVAHTASEYELGMAHGRGRDRSVDRRSYSEGGMSN
ncbi:MAG: hypothetical protein U5K73_04690 [Halofilum sp. (in: g-proteobacteria)]|nr:hypothetical protein [Halofilum sp. (in: g-proteobacteria)]